MALSRKTDFKKVRVRMYASGKNGIFSSVPYTETVEYYEADNINENDLTATQAEGENDGFIDTLPEKKQRLSFKERIKRILPTRRKIIQLYAALLFNANIKGFITGEIFKGASKNICSPGINCYSCPGAVGACPLGSLQNELNTANKRTPYYVVGILLLYGMLFGRFICGFLCPFGLIQELLHKIKTPKLKKSKVTRLLSYLKYVILAFFVVIVPVMYGLKDMPLPAFCKYICPAGTIEGAFTLLSSEINNSMFSMLGPLFTWKFVLTVSIIVLSVLVFRFFCRFICPLGAIYGFFNKISIFGIKLNRDKCTECGLCVSKCKMDIKHVGDHECISCGECISVCPTKAISWKGSKIFLPEDEIAIPDDATESEATIIKQKHEEKKQRANKRNKILRIVASILMVAILGGALVYYNFIYKAPELPVPEEGNEVGDLCPSYDLKTFDENGMSGEVFNPSTNTGKITIINFWGTWCTGCVMELPYFDQIATEYKDNVTVVAIHSYYLFESTASEYVGQSYAESDIIFAADDSIDSSAPDVYYTTLGGVNDAYPFTVILDENGVIIESWLRSATYEQLKEVVERELNN